MNFKYNIRFFYLDNLKCLFEISIYNRITLSLVMIIINSFLDEPLKTDYFLNIMYV